MSHHHHSHPPQPHTPSNNHHPNDHAGDQFVAVVGKVSGPLGDADDNHVRINLHVASGTGAGTYAVQFNVESTSGPSEAEYYLLDELIADGNLPPEGVSQTAHLDYREMGLKQENFKTINNGNLRTIVHSSVDKAIIVASYGFTFPGHGVHMIHFNNGEAAASSHANHPHQDGALALFYKDASGQLIRRWVFLKFQTQTL